MFFSNFVTNHQRSYRKILDNSPSRDGQQEYHTLLPESHSTKDIKYGWANLHAMTTENVQQTEDNDRA